MVKGDIRYSGTNKKGRYDARRNLHQLHLSAPQANKKGRYDGIDPLYLPFLNSVNCDYSDHFFQNR